MSTASDTYSCPACTFIQSIKRPTCEVCGTANPNFDSSDEAFAAALSRRRIGDGTMQCPQCSYINVGYDIQICENCTSNFYDMNNLMRGFLQNYDEEAVDSNSDDNEIQHDDDEDVVMGEDPAQPPPPPPPTTTTTNTSQKAAAAVEKPMDDNDLRPFYSHYILLMQDQKQQKKSFTEEDLHTCLIERFESLQYKNDESNGQLTFNTCQVCLDEDGPMVTMKACGHRVVCAQDFNRYLSVRIREGDILPWIPCPAESCFVPCHVDNIIKDGGLTYWQILTFLTTYMLKKLSRNENFITCIQCEKGGFLQFGPPKKQQVTCSICNERQTIEKGVDGDLDIDFKKMIKSGDLRECPTCRHLTLKEKGLCNIIECAKCGIWWNWRTKEQGHNGKDMKQRARMNGTLWEPGELHYQQQLERQNPEAFKALLERNGIKYNPNYIRGGWNEH